MNKNHRKISLKIKNLNRKQETSVEPIESIWNELRHTQSSITYISVLLDDKSMLASQYKDSWKQEIEGLRNKLIDLRQHFCELYKGIQCILQEFEIKKYDRPYLEIILSFS